MRLSTEQLSLNSDAAIDLQLHTLYSDGRWTAEALLDYLIQENFALAAITDHDRTDTLVSLQNLAHEKQFPLLVAVEMSSFWQGELLDILCYGFDPEKNKLNALAQNIAQRQVENTQAIIENLSRQGYQFPDEAEINSLLAKPSSQQAHALLALLQKLGYGSAEKSAGKMMLEAGFAYATTPPEQIVDAAHQSGAVCLIAHPGRSDGFVQFDRDLLDEFRRQIPIDGIEVYYPLHSPEQIASFADYAQKHNLLISSGSDSHAQDKPPIKYPAHYSQKLLERLGIEIRL